MQFLRSSVRAASIDHLHDAVIRGGKPILQMVLGNSDRNNFEIKDSA